MKRLLLSLTLLPIGVSPLRAMVLRVPSDYPSIQAGIDAAVDGDTVLVAPGTYTGSGNTNCSFLGKAILVTSEMGPDSTIIDSPTYIAFSFDSGETRESILSGFQITNMTHAIVLYFASPTIDNCRILYCGSQFLDGGGIDISEGSPLITNCEFGYCWSFQGRGPAIKGAAWDITVVNSVFYNNWSGYFYPVVSAAGFFVNCTFYYNDGYGLGTSNDSQVINCIFWDNYFGGIAGNPSVSYSDLEELWPGEGNISEDPLFVDPENDDYNLLPESPCIDAGDPDTPNIRWGGFRRDMGAFEYDQGFYFDGQNLILKPFPIRIPWLQ